MQVYGIRTTLYACCTAIHVVTKREGVITTIPFQHLKINLVAPQTTIIFQGTEYRVHAPFFVLSILLLHVDLNPHTQRCSMPFISYTYVLHISFHIYHNHRYSK